MSTSIEQRVVQMRFDNKQFESGVAQSMSTLDKLESKLQFKNSTKGFQEITKAAANVSLDSIVKQTDNAGNQFNALAVIAISALNRITNDAITAGKNLVKSLSIDQVNAGWSKYEARTAAVQTLVNATGKSVEQIEKYMDKLMLYSDETSYGFADMTSALATMVSAGGDISKLVPLLEGFGNAVSFVGKGASEYSRAIIQLSQGYGRDALMLEDWKSIESTLGGAKQLKEVFIQVAEEQKKIAKGNITIGTFNESLKNKWLDQKVMEEALGRFAEMTEKAFAMIDAGEAESVSEAYEILSKSVNDYRINAAKAAQEAKSFTEAIDATKDAVSTKWMESFQIIFGNYKEATDLWTELTETLWDLFAASGDTRNEILRVWRAFDGRDEMIKAVKAAFNALYVPVRAVGDAINEIFFPGNVAQKGNWLYNATVAAKEFFLSLQLSEEATVNLKKGIKLLLIPVYALYTALRVVGYAGTQLISLIFALGNALLELPSHMDDVKAALKNLLGEERYNKIASALVIIFEKLENVLGTAKKAIISIGKSISDAFSSRMTTSISKLMEFLAPIAGWILDKLVEGFEYLASLDYSKIVDIAMAGFDMLVDGFTTLLGWCKKGKDAVIDFFSSFFKMSPVEVLDNIVNTLRNFKDNMSIFIKKIGLTETFNNISTTGNKVAAIFKAIGDAIWAFASKLTPAKILLFSFGVSMVWMFTNLAVAIDAFKGIATGVSGTLGAITGTLKAFQSRIKGSPILQAAAAIAVLAASLGLLAQLDSDKLVKAAVALTVVVTSLIGMTVALAFISKKILDFELYGYSMIKASQSMLLMAGAAAVLSGALYILTNINLDGIIGKLVVFAVTLGAMVIALNSVAKGMSTTIADAVYIIAFAATINLMVLALSKLNDFNLDLTIDNMVSIVAVVALMMAIGFAAKGVKASSGFGLILFAATLLAFTKMIAPISNINFAKIIKAMLNVITIFGTLAIINKLMGENTIIKSGAGLLSLAAGIWVLYFAIQKIGNLKQEVVMQGTLAVGAIMLFVGAMNALMNLTTKKETEIVKLQGSFLALSAAILVLGVAIDYIGNLDLKVAVRGGVVVTVLMGTLTILAKAIGTIQKATSSVIAMGVCIGLLTASMALMTLLDEMNLIKVAASLGGVFIALGVLFKLIGQGLGIVKAITTVALIATTVEVIGRAFKALHSLGNPLGLLEIAAGIGLVLAAFGASMALMNTNKILNTADMKRAGVTIATMAGMVVSVGVVMGLIGGIFGAFHIDTSRMIEQAAAIGIVMLALGKSMDLFNIKTAKDDNMKKTISLMRNLAIIAGVITAIFALPLFANSGDMIGKALSFGIIITAMTGSVALISLLASKLKGITAKTVEQINSLSGVVIALGIVAGIITVFLSIVPSNGDMISKIVMFGGVLLAITGVMVILAATSKLFEAAGKAADGMVTGILGVMKVLVLIMAFITLVGAIATLYDRISGGDLTAFLENTVATFTAFGEAIGGFFGGILGGFGGTAIAITLDLVGKALEDFGTSLNNFATNMGAFKTLKIDKSATDAVASLTYTISKWAGIEANNALLSIGSDTDRMTQFADHLVSFVGKFGPVIEDLASIQNTDRAIEAAGTVESLAAAMEIMKSSKIKDTDIETFKTGISGLGGALAEYAKQLAAANITDDILTQTETLTGTVMTLYEKLPKTGGWAQAIFGESDFGEFGEDLRAFMSALAYFAMESNFITTTYGDVDYDKIYDMTAKLAELAGKVPEVGVLQDWLGKHDIGVFGEQLQSFASGLAGFFITLSGVNIDQSVVDSVKNAGDTMVELANTVPNTGTVYNWFLGKDLGIFGGQLKDFGEGLRDFYKAFNEVELDDDTVTLAKNAGLGLTAIANSLESNEGVVQFWTGSTNLSKFGEEVKKLGEGMADFYDELDGVKLSSGNFAIGALERIVAMAPSMKNIKSSDINGFTEYLNSLSSIGVSGFIETFESAEELISTTVVTTLTNALATAKTKMSGSYNDYGFISTNIAYGITKNSPKITEAIKGLGMVAFAAAKGLRSTFEDVGAFMASSMITGLKSETSNFADAGSNAVTSFTKGVEKEQNNALKKVSEFGNKIVDSFEVALGVNSPSTKFAEVGKYSVLGYKKGIEDNIRDGEKAMIKMGETLLDSIQDYYGINSPSTVMRDEVGRYIVQGIAVGITEDMSAEEAAAQKAQNIIDAFQSEFDKWSAKTSSAELDYKLAGYTNGSATESEIKDREVALLEEKLANQAERVNAANAQYKILMESGYATDEQIRKAMDAIKQEQINMWDLAEQLVNTRAVAAEALDLERAELEFEQWKLLNSDAEEDEVKEKELEVIKKRLENQALAAETANKTYIKYVELYGEEAKKTKEALNNYLTEQNSLIEMANDFIKDYNIDLPDQDDILAARKADQEWYMTMYDQYKEGKITWEKLRELYDEFGQVNMFSALEQRQEATDHNITAAELMDEYMTSVKDKIDDMESASEIIDRYIANAAGSIDGIIGNLQYYLDETPVNMTSATSTKNTTADVSNMVGGIKKQLEEELTEVGSELDMSGIMDQLTESMGGGFIDGIRNSLGGFGDNLIGSIGNGFNKLKEFLGIGQTTGTVPDTANGVINTFTSTITSPNSNIKILNSAKTVQTAFSEGTADMPKAAEDTGAAVVNGLVAGINANAYKVKNAMAGLASVTVDSTNQTLDIHSPSRVFYWIGEMIDVGLANGIDDSSNVVTNALQSLLDNAKNTMENTELSANIRPVVTDADTYDLYSRQSLSITDDGSITPYGYTDQFSWWTETGDRIATSIQQLAASEEARRSTEEATLNQYKMAVQELKTAAKSIAEKPSGVNFTQNNYSPQSLSSGKIYRNTKSALATTWIKVSPTGKDTRN